MGMSIIRKEEVDGGFITKPQVIENGEVKYANKVMCWLYRFCEQEIIIMLITASKTYCSICIPLMFKQSLNMQNVWKPGCLTKSSRCMYHWLVLFSWLLCIRQWTEHVYQQIWSIKPIISIVLCYDKVLQVALNIITGCVAFDSQVSVHIPTKRDKLSPNLPWMEWGSHSLVQYM